MHCFNTRERIREILRVFILHENCVSNEFSLGECREAAFWSRQVCFFFVELVPRETIVQRLKLTACYKTDVTNARSDIAIGLLVAGTCDGRYYSEPCTKHPCNLRKHTRGLACLSRKKRRKKLVKDQFSFANQPFREGEKKRGSRKMARRKARD